MPTEFLARIARSLNAKLSALMRVSGRSANISERLEAKVAWDARQYWGLVDVENNDLLWVCKSMQTIFR
jgi:hypothetical protein